jgi:predicted RND superfamily exporter protein
VRPIYSCWLSAILFLVALPGLLHLSLTPDNRVLMDPADPRVVELNLFEDSFRAQNVVGIVASCSKGEPRCIRQLPDTIREIHRLSHSIPYVDTVNSLANHPSLRSDENSVENANFLDRHCSDGCDPNLFYSEHPPSVLRLSNRSGDTMGVFTSLKFDTADSSAVFEIQERLLEIEKELGNRHLASIHFVGRVPLMHAFVETSVEEIFGFMGLAILLIGVLLVLAFGNVLLALTSLTLSTATIITTLGFAGWSGLVLSTGSAAIATIILTLSTATAMHYFMHVVRIMSEDQNRDQRKAAEGAVSYQFSPIVLTAGTTFIAMLSMLLVESPPFRDLGLWTAVSMPICVLYLFSIVPLVVAKLPKLKRSAWHLLLQPILNNHARAAGKRKTTAYIAIALALIAAGNISQLSFDDDFIRYFSTDTRFRADSDHVSNVLIGPTNIEVSVRAPATINDPSFLLSIDRFANSLRSETEIQSVYSIVDVLDFFGPHLIEQDWRRLDNQDLIAQLIFFYELSLGVDQPKNDLISDDETSLRVSIIAADISSREIVKLEKVIRNLADEQSLEVVVTGEALPIAYLSEKNIPNIALSLLFSLLGTSVALGFFFRSASLGAILFVTTIVPILCGFGIWTLYEASIGIAATIILCISTGVVIDDTIHMVYRFNYALKTLNLELEEAISYTVHRVGNAICTTTLILAAGFGILAFSSFKVNSTFGACTILVLVGAMLIDLLILPTLLTMTRWNAGTKFELTGDTNNSPRNGL